MNQVAAVVSVHIAPGCLESNPCQHSAKLRLRDGTEKTIYFRGNEGWLLLRLFKERIVGDSQEDHFDSCAPSNCCLNQLKSLDGERRIRQMMGNDG